MVKQPEQSTLFTRIAAILDEARSSVVRTVDSTMVLTYWNIGREIVLELQSGELRAEYGSSLIKQLSEKLTDAFGRGFSTTNLRYFRTFYTVYADRVPKIHSISEHLSKCHIDCGVLDDLELSLQKPETAMGFSENLSWSHYRSLMGIEHLNERLFYEIESEKERWDHEQLKHQIHTFLFARLLKSLDKEGLLSLTREGQALTKPADSIKNPYILDFLGIPDKSQFHESDLESAIIANLQEFLLELGKGFAFVGRQKRLQFDDTYFYVDLVFYNCILKSYLLIDLKIGELTHQDVGQMDSYVRMFDDKYCTEGDNPTIGLILCSKGNETIAKYSVLRDSSQLFASRYMLYLPSEEELVAELAREKRRINEQKEYNS